MGSYRHRPFSGPAMYSGLFRKRILAGILVMGLAVLSFHEMESSKIPNAGQRFLSPRTRFLRPTIAPRIRSFRKNDITHTLCSPNSVFFLNSDPDPNELVAEKKEVSVEVTQERKDALRLRFEKKLGKEEAEKVMPRILDLEAKLTQYDEKERNRRIAISISNSGKKPWNTGRKHSPETLNKIRERTAAAMKRPEILKKLRNGSPANISTKTRSKPRPRTTTASPRATAKKRAKKAQRELQKVKMAEQRQQALDRLDACEVRVRLSSSFPEDWDPLTHTNLKIYRERVREEMQREKFEGTISEQQLRDFEEMVKYLQVFREAKLESKVCQRELHRMETELNKNPGEYALLKGYLEYSMEDASQIVRLIENASTKLLKLEDVRELVKSWTTICKKQLIESTNRDDDNEGVLDPVIANIASPKVVEALEGNDGDKSDSSPTASSRTLPNKSLFLQGSRSEPTEIMTVLRGRTSNPYYDPILSEDALLISK